MDSGKNVDEVLRDLCEEVNLAFESSRNMSEEKRKEVMINNVRNFYTALVQSNLPEEYSVELNCEESDDPTMIKIQGTVYAPEYLIYEVERALNDGE